MTWPPGLGGLFIMGWMPGFLPAMAEPQAADLARSGPGAGLAPGGIGLQRLGQGWLIAPFGATEVLVFAVPNRPFTQPWSVVVGIITRSDLVSALAKRLSQG